MLLIVCNHIDTDTALRKVSGLSLVKRIALGAEAAGISRIVVVAPRDGAAPISDELEDRRFRNLPDVIEAEVGSLPRPRGVADDDDVVVIYGDRVALGTTYRAMAAPLSTAERARIASTGDGRKPWSGIARLKARDLSTLVSPEGASQAELLSRFGALAGEPSELNVVGGLSFRAVQSRGDVRDAETLLLRGLVKAADGLVSRHINRKISLFLSRRLARWPVHPNHVTAVVFLIGVAAGPLAFFLGGYAGVALGGLCYYVSAILDGCDGELSRLKHLGSPLGAWLDTITDDVVCLSFILGLYPRLALDAGGSFWWWVGGGGLFFYLLTVLPRYWVMATRLRSGDFQKLAASRKPKPEALTAFGRASEAVRNAIFRTDFLPFYGFVTAAACFPQAFALPFAIGSIASAVDTLVTVTERR